MRFSSSRAGANPRRFPPRCSSQCALILAASLGAMFVLPSLQGETILVLPFTNRTPPVKPDSVPATAASPAKNPNGIGMVNPPGAAFIGAAPAAGNPVNSDAPPASNLDWIGESIAETIRDAFETRGVITNSRDEIEQAYRRLNLRPRGELTQASVLKLGEALDAERVLYGTYMYTADPGPSRGGTLSISAHLIDRRHLRETPEFTENGNLDDLPLLEAHLTWRALHLASPKLAPPESEFRTLRPPVRLDAEENYVRGLLASSPDQRERFFLQATRLDPKFAHPNLALGRLHYDRKEYRQAADWLQKIAPEDSHFRSASFLLGLALFQSGDFAGAQRAFQTVAEAVPLSEVFNNLGAAQSRQNLPQALDSFQKALAGDANDPLYLFNVGYVLWKKGDFTAAADRFRAVLDRQPEDQYATLMLGMCLKKQGPHAGDARVESLERLKTNYDERAYLQLKALVSPQ